MIPEAREVRLKPKIRKVLEARCGAPTTPQRDVKRARMILLAADGRSTRSIAQEVLQRQSLTGVSFTSVTRLKEHIDAFIASYNANAAPFVWTKATVHQRRIKGRRISQL